jgi:HSP20 family molecular chaperone IbpA
MFERRFPLPPWFDTDCITARYTMGVLEIVLARPDDESSEEFKVKIA